MNRRRTPAISGVSPLRAALILAVSGALIVAACTTDPPARDEENRRHDRNPGGRPETSVPIPYASGAEESASRFRMLRKTDLCALLDPDAAQQVVGEASTADRLLPETFGRCTLHVTPAGVRTSVDAWTFTAETVPFDDFSISEEGAKPVEVPGAPANAFYRPKSSPSDPVCTIVRPLAEPEGWALRLDVRGPFGLSTERVPSCDIAIPYLGQVRGRWLDPPAHTDQLTEPHLPLAERDPCEATVAIGAALNRPVQARPIDPHSCMVVTSSTSTDGSGASSSRRTEMPGSEDIDPPPTGGAEAPGDDTSAESGTDASELHVAYTFAVDPATREPADTEKGPLPITIGDRDGTRTTDDDGACTVAVAVDDDTYVDTDDGGRVQVINVTAADCDNAATAAEAVLTTITGR